MREILTKFRTVLLVAKRGEFKEIAEEARQRFYSNSSSLILRRDLSIPLEPPIAKLPITVRPIRDGDLAEIIRERPRRYPVLRANIPTCYIAQSNDGDLCYTQWLVAPKEQGNLAPYFKGQLNELRDDEVLLEFAYTFEKFRGQGVMAAAMAAIAEQGISTGAQWAITYVKDDNVASLKGCAKAGFRPYMVREERWRFFRLNQTFRLLPAGTKYSFESELPAKTEIDRKNEPTRAGAIAPHRSATAISM
jgi:GNAT superfamily N-acetyltransferase